MALSERKETSINMAIRVSLNMLGKETPSALELALKILVHGTSQ